MVNFMFYIHSNVYSVQKVVKRVQLFLPISVKQSWAINSFLYPISDSPIVFYILYRYSIVLVWYRITDSFPNLLSDIWYSNSPIVKMLFDSPYSDFPIVSEKILAAKTGALTKRPRLKRPSNVSTPSERPPNTMSNCSLRPL
jgi:hypothetical protein